MKKLRVLYIAHNHPSVRPGGAEAYALEVHEAMRTTDEFEPVLLAKGGPPMSPVGRLHAGTYFGPVGRHPDQYFMYTDGYAFDYLLGTMSRKDIYTRHFRGFLQAIQPDIVHFQHTLHLGYDLIREVRNTLPDAPILYTLHEYLPICHRQGQMVRTTGNDERCSEESPRRCHECFPTVSPQTFFLRKRFIQALFDQVDLFIAPSLILRERYIDWGIAPDRIRLMDYGRLPVQRVAVPATDRPRNRFGFFGQFTPFKGPHVLLEAMKLIARELAEARQRAGAPTDAAWSGGQPHLWVHGANLDFQPSAYQSQFRELLEATRDHVTLVGRYDHRELPRLLANLDWVVVPSIWWENSPLVIQEAFLHRRPVICSDIGGMAEKVTHEVNGLHFRTGDPASLARTLQMSAGTPGLWDRLCSGIPEIYPMDQHVADLAAIYHELLARKHSTPLAHVH